MNCITDEQREFGGMWCPHCGAKTARAVECYSYRYILIECEKSFPYGHLSVWDIVEQINMTASQFSYEVSSYWDSAIIDRWTRALDTPDDGSGSTDPSPAEPEPQGYEVKI